jgi:hypothetical protein
LRGYIFSRIATLLLQKAKLLSDLRLPPLSGNKHASQMMPMIRALVYLVIMMMLMIGLPSYGKSKRTESQIEVTAETILELCKSSQFSGMNRSNVMESICE